MKRLRSYLTVLIMLVVASYGMAGESVGKIRILGVGNSFTLNSTRYLPAFINTNEEIEADIGVAYIGGGSIGDHVKFAKLHEADPEDPKGRRYRYHFNGKVKMNGASLKEMLLDGVWDYITIQQVSYESYKIDSYYPHVTELTDYIKKYAPDARIVIHETWAHRVDCPRVEQWNLPPGEMYEKLNAAYAQIAKDLQAPVIPVGTAFENAKKHPLWQYAPPQDFDPKTLVWPDELPDQSKSLHKGYSWGTAKDDKDKKILKMDGYHAGLAGQYLGSLVWYEFFFERDAREVSFTPGELSEEQGNSLRAAAHTTMENARAELAEAEETETPMKSGVGAIN